jgi:hypothetical protein
MTDPYQGYGPPEDAVPTGEYPIRITLKGGTGAAPWVTYGFQNVQAAEEVISSLEFETLLEHVTKVSLQFAGVSATPPAGGATQAAPAGQPYAAQQAPAWMGAAPVCAHGTKTYITRTKNGKPWHAWGCPVHADEGGCGLTFPKR